MDGSLISGSSSAFHSAFQSPTSSSISSDPGTPTGCLPDGQSARARSCDVYIGFCSRKLSLLRFVNWLRAELELHGILCHVSDRSRCSDASTQRAAREAMGCAMLGIVVITRSTFSSPYSVQEVMMFLERKNLMPIFFGLTHGDCIVRDIVEKRGKFWDRRGGLLWTLYNGSQKDWMEAVNGLSHVDFKLEAQVGNWRDCISEAVLFVSRKLGRRSVVEGVKKWKEWVKEEEFPFPRNEEFVGRKKEIQDLELILYGSADRGGDRGNKSPFHMQHVESMATETSDRKLAGWYQGRMRKGKNPLLSEEGQAAEIEGINSSMKLQNHMRSPLHLQHGKGFACVSGEAGIGKTELLLEFAYRFHQRYRMVLWIGGEARYFCQNYMNLLPSLGIEMQLEDDGCRGFCRPTNFEAIEEQSISMVRKELMRDIPYLLVIDNLEAETDWWIGRSVMDFLPVFGRETHVIISTRLPRILNIEPINLLCFSAHDSLTLMKGNWRYLRTEEVDILRSMEEKLRGTTLGLSIVRAIFTELSISPQKLFDVISKMPYREAHWSDNKDHSLKLNPFLIQLLDACFSMIDSTGVLNYLMRKMVQASGWFAPSPIPVALLALAAHEVPEEHHDRKSWNKWIGGIKCKLRPWHAKKLEYDASSMLVRLHIARKTNREGYIHCHDLIRRYAREIGNVNMAYAMVKAVNIRGSLPQHIDHVWAACFLLLKFGTDPGVVDLNSIELISFIRRLVLPMALETFNTFCRCRATLELLRLSAEKLESLEELYLSEAGKEFEKSSCWKTYWSQPRCRIDPLIYHEFALLRANLLETRTKIMMRGGLYDVAELLCRTALSIKEVIYGFDHPETTTTRETVKRLVGLQTNV